MPFKGEDVGHVARAIFIVVGSLEIIVGVAGNCLLLTVLFTRRLLDRRSYHNLFIADLAVADLLTLGYWMGFFVLDLILGYHPVANETHCIANGFIVSSCILVTMLSVVFISLNRFIHVCHSRLYPRIFSKRATVIFSLLIWVIAAIMTAPPLFGFGGYYYKVGSHTCTFNQHLYPKTAAVVSIISSTLMIGYFNLAIFKYWRRAKRNLLRNLPRPSAGNFQSFLFHVCPCNQRPCTQDTESKGCDLIKAHHEAVNDNESKATTSHVHAIELTTQMESADTQENKDSKIPDKQRNEAEALIRCETVIVQASITSTNSTESEDFSKTIPSLSVKDNDNEHSTEGEENENRTEGIINEQSVEGDQTEHTANGHENKRSNEGDEKFSAEGEKNERAAEGHENENSNKGDEKEHSDKAYVVHNDQRGSVNDSNKIAIFSQDLEESADSHSDTDDTKSDAKEGFREEEHVSHSVRTVNDGSTSVAAGPPTAVHGPFVADFCPMTGACALSRDFTNIAMISTYDTDKTHEKVEAKKKVKTKASETQRRPAKQCNAKRKQAKERSLRCTLSLKRTQQTNTYRQQAKARARRTQNQQSREHAFVRSLAVVSLLMVICFVPFGISKIIEQSSKLSAEVNISLSLLLFLNCSLNWIVYGVMNRSFRREYARLLRRVFGSSMTFVRGVTR